MTRLLLLLISCATLFAQRTPFKVNGTVVNNPDLTNSATITWTIVGATISGAAAGGGGDTIWTNDNGTIKLVQPIANEADGTPIIAVDSSVAHTSGDLAKLRNLGTNAFEFGYQGQLIMGLDASSVPFNNFTYPGVRAVSVAPLDGLGLSVISVDAFKGIPAAGVSTNRADVELDAESDAFFRYAEMSVEDWDENGHEHYVFAYTDEGPTVEIVMGDYEGVITRIEPTMPDGAGTPYDFGTLVSRGSGYLFRFGNDAGKNHLTNKITGSWDGVVTAVGGFSSTSTDAAVTIASTGWTNTLGKNAQVMMDGVALVYKVADAAGTFWYTNGTALSGAEFTLQTGGKFIITSGTLNVGRAKAW